MNSISERDPIATHVTATSIPVNTVCRSKGAARKPQWRQIKPIKQTNYVPSTVTYDFFSLLLAFLVQTFRPTARNRKEGLQMLYQRPWPGQNRQISTIRREI